MVFADARAVDWEAEIAVRQRGRMATAPLVSLCYAQSLDGSLTAEAGQPLALSGPAALEVTHRLRAAHAAILVGSGTLLADDPRLNVRLASGPDPRPVILDGRLRTPPTARLLADPNRRPLIFTHAAADPQRRAALEAAHAEVVAVSAAADGRLDLTAVVAACASRGLASLMVEGGAAVLSAFLAARLGDWAVVTLAPLFVGGLRTPEARLEPPVRLPAPRYAACGSDLIVWGDLT
jgi:3,4-dihydroxy 2-butanone 4-phosphate synthase/GTP cyclohydrolase II